jgi:hypothetical protein
LCRDYFERNLASSLNGGLHSIESFYKGRMQTSSSAFCLDGYTARKRRVVVIYSILTSCSHIVRIACPNRYNITSHQDFSAMCTSVAVDNIPTHTACPGRHPDHPVVLLVYPAGIRMDILRSKHTISSNVLHDSAFEKLIRDEVVTTRRPPQPPCKAGSLASLFSRIQSAGCPTCLVFFQSQFFFYSLFTE